MKVKDIKEDKKDWLVIENFHERYSFETNLSVFHNIDLLDLIRKYFKIEIDLEDEIEVEKYFDGSCYIIDKTRHNLLDTDYEAPELKNVPIKKVMFNTICFISLENFLNSEHFSFVWGFTNSKFGLLDREGEL